MTPSYTKNVRCYISSPTFLDTAPLRQLLRSMGFDVATIEDEPPAGVSLALQLEQQIRTATFVCGVIPSNTDAGSVMFELGVALGAGKPIFLIAGSKSELPAALRWLPFVEATTNDIDIIKFHLDVFAANLSLTEPLKFYGGGASSDVNAAPNIRTISKVRPVRPMVFAGGGDAYGIANAAQIAALPLAERTIATAFQREGASVTLSHRFGEDSVADMLVWLTDAEIGLPGPILVEIKDNLAEPFSMQSLQSVKGMLQKSHLRSAIIVSGGSDTKLQARFDAGYFIFSISISALEALSQGGELVENLKRARNRSAHGFA